MNKERFEAFKALAYLIEESKRLDNMKTIKTSSSH